MRMIKRGQWFGAQCLVEYGKTELEDCCHPRADLPPPRNRVAYLIYPVNSLNERESPTFAHELTLVECLSEEER
jgi:hypothetical protein